MVDVTAVEPENEHALFALAVAYHRQGKLSLAQDMFLRTLSVNSSHLSALYNLGLMYMQAQRYVEAKEIASRLVDLQPLHARGLALVADCHTHLREYESAVRVYSRAIAASNGSPECTMLSNYGEAIATGNLYTCACSPLCTQCVYLVWFTVLEAIHCTKVSAYVVN